MSEEEQQPQLNFWDKEEKVSDDPAKDMETQTHTPNFIEFVGAKDIRSMIVPELNQIQPLILPTDAWRDHKKLTKFLKSVETAVNNQIKGVGKMMEKYAQELLARPTYSETYFNFRMNVRELTKPVDVSPDQHELDLDDRQKDGYKDHAETCDLPHDVDLSASYLAGNIREGMSANSRLKMGEVHQSSDQIDGQRARSMLGQLKEEIALEEKQKQANEQGRQTHQSKHTEQSKVPKIDLKKLGKEEDGQGTFGAREGTGSNPGAHETKQKIINISGPSQKDVLKPKIQHTDVSAANLQNPNTQPDNMSSGRESEIIQKKVISASEREHSLHSKYFVSNMFVEKIFDTMTCTYKTQLEKMEASIAAHDKMIHENTEKLNASLPLITQNIEAAQQRQKMAVIKLYEYIEGQKQKELKKKVFKFFDIHRQKNVANCKKVQRLLNVFRKYQLHHGWGKFSKNVNWEIQLMERGRIDGAYLLLKRFKGRLKMFDKALEKLHIDKTGKDEFNNLCQSLDKHRAQSIMSDMKKLFQGNMAEALTKMNTHKDKLQIHCDEVLTNQHNQIVQFEKKYSFLANQKVTSLQKFMDEIALEQGKMAEKVNEFDLMYRQATDGASIIERYPKKKKKSPEKLKQNISIHESGNIENSQHFNSGGRLASQDTMRDPTRRDITEELDPIMVQEFKPEVMASRATGENTPMSSCQNTERTQAYNNRKDIIELNRVIKTMQRDQNELQHRYNDLHNYLQQQQQEQVQAQQVQLIQENLRMTGTTGTYAGITSPTGNCTEMTNRHGDQQRHLQGYGTAPGGKLYTHATLKMQEQAEKLSVNAASIKISSMIEHRGSQSSNTMRRKQLQTAKTRTINAQSNSNIMPALIVNSYDVADRNKLNPLSPGQKSTPSSGMVQVRSQLSQNNPCSKHFKCIDKRSGPIAMQQLKQQRDSSLNNSRNQNMRMNVSSKQSENQLKRRNIPLDEKQSPVNVPGTHPLPIQKRSSSVLLQLAQGSVERENKEIEDQNEDEFKVHSSNASPLLPRHMKSQNNPNGSIQSDVDSPSRLDVRYQGKNRITTDTPDPDTSNIQ